MPPGACRSRPGRHIGTHRNARWRSGSDHRCHPPRDPGSGRRIRNREPAGQGRSCRMDAAIGGHAHIGRHAACIARCASRSDPDRRLRPTHLPDREYPRRGPHPSSTGRCRRVRPACRDRADASTTPDAGPRRRNMPDQPAFTLAVEPGKPASMRSCPQSILRQSAIPHRNTSQRHGPASRWITDRREPHRNGRPAGARRQGCHPRAPESGSSPEDRAPPPSARDPSSGSFRRTASTDIAHRLRHSPPACRSPSRDKRTDCIPDSGVSSAIRRREGSPHHGIDGIGAGLRRFPEPGPRCRSERNLP